MVVIQPSIPIRKRTPYRATIGGQIDAARRLLAGVGWDKAAETYRTTMTGSTAPEATALDHLDTVARRQLAEADKLAARAETAITAIITRLGGNGSPTVDQHVDRSVTNQHGDRYPVEFGEDAARSMPPRAVPVQQRLRALGLRRWLGLSHHVEMKAVAVLLSVGGGGGEARINHAPAASSRATLVAAIRCCQTSSHKVGR
jgi:hypothetical protein